MEFLKLNSGIAISADGHAPFAVRREKGLEKEGFASGRVIWGKATGEPSRRETGKADSDRGEAEAR